MNASCLKRAREAEEDPIERKGGREAEQSAIQSETINATRDVDGGECIAGKGSLPRSSEYCAHNSTETNHSVESISKDQGSSASIIPMLTSSSLPPPVILSSSSLSSSSSVPHIRTVSIGGVKVAQIAIGTLPLGVSYPEPDKRPTREETVQIIRAAAALSRDVPTLFDTADWYCVGPLDKGYMENVLSEAISSDTDSLIPKGLIATKGGMNRVGSESNSWRPLAITPEYDPRSAIEDSISALGREAFLWQLHHCDKKGDLIKMIMHRVLSIKTSSPGLIKHVGLCNVTLDQIIQARSVYPDIVTIQNKFNFWLGPKPLGDEFEIISYCEKAGLVYMAYNVFGGLNARKNEVSLTDDFEEEFLVLAKKKGVSPHGLMLGWMINKWPGTVMPIVGLRSAARLKALVEAYSLRFSDEEIRTFPNYMKKKRKSGKN